MTFLEFTPHDEKQLYTLDIYFGNEAAKAFTAEGMKITPKLLAVALHSLPEDKRKAVLLYYFMEMSDVETGQPLDIPRSMVQYRRINSFELLKKYLEERAIVALPGYKIVAANGDANAMVFVMERYESHITDLSIRKPLDERGNTYLGIDAAAHSQSLCEPSFHSGFRVAGLCPISAALVYS